MKFRKRPVVVEAFQMTPAARLSNANWPEWLHEAWNADPDSTGALFIDELDPKRLRLLIRTLEGVVRVDWGAWIIRGVAGELYPCKPDIFAATYEPEEVEP